MDFLKLLKSFEEFVYEALLWLILVPITLGRIVLQPRTMTAYAAKELALPDERRFNFAVSPPLLLILCVVIAQAFDMGVRTQAEVSEESLANLLLASEQNLLLYRTIAFGIWALVGAAYFLIRSGIPVSRDSLRVPFYEQCYLVSPFALALSFSVSLSLTDRRGAIVGVALVLVGTLWFWVVQADWMQQKARMPLWRSLVAATLILLIGALANTLVGQALSHARPTTSPSHVRGAH
ncbi:MAG: hypothetical protein ABI843_01400 [Dokdonella sp.]